MSSAISEPNTAPNTRGTQYAIEKELADKLRQAPRQQRGSAYTWLQEELARRMPGHPSLSPPSPADRKKTDGEARFLRRFLRPNGTFLEVGPGDYSLVAKVANYAARVLAVDIASEASQTQSLPANCHIVISDGQRVQAPESSVDVAYSCELTEHLHPEDAQLQLDDIYKALKPGGVYICITPNRLNGPHDGSRSFEDVAAGLHIREYTRGELIQLFCDGGFRQVRAYVGKGGFLIRAPVHVVTLCEKGLAALRRGFRTRLANTAVARALLSARLIAIK